MLGSSVQPGFAAIEFGLQPTPHAVPDVLLGEQPAQLGGLHAEHVPAQRREVIQQRGIV